MTQQNQQQTGDQQQQAPPAPANQGGQQPSQAQPNQQQQQNQQTNNQPAIPEDLQAQVVTGQDGKPFVPIAALLDERTKRQDFESRLTDAEQRMRALDDQLFLYRMTPMQQPGQQPQQHQGQQPGQQQAQQQSQKSILDGMQDGEMITAGELRQIISMLQPTPNQGGGMNEQDAQAFRMFSEGVLQGQHADYEQVVMGGFRQRLAREPWLAQHVNAVHPLLQPMMVYRLGKGQDPQQAAHGAQQDYSRQQQQGGQPPQQQQPSQGQQQAQQIMQNAQAPPMTSNVVSGSPLDTASRFSSMSQEEFEAYVEKVKAGG